MIFITQSDAKIISGRDTSESLILLIVASVTVPCIAPLGNSGFCPLGKPAATELRYPTYGACWVFECFLNPPNSDMKNGAPKVLPQDTTHRIR